MRSTVSILAALMLTACYNKATDVPTTGNTVARVGTATLSRQQIHEAMPEGLSEADSAEYVRQYVDRWIDGQLIDQAATTVLDMQEIDKRVDKYRRDLIIAEYRRYCFDRRSDTVFTEEQLQDYYNRHKELFETERPMVRGIYLKIPDNAKDLKEIRRLLQQSGQKDIDKLEGLVAGTAIHYDYFMEKWVEWRQIEQLIPTRFDSEPTAVFRGQKMLDLSIGGFTYLLKVSEYRPGGTTLTFEEAVPQIRQRLTNRQRMNFDATFQQRIRQDAEKEGIVEIML